MIAVSSNKYLFDRLKFWIVIVNYRKMQNAQCWGVRHSKLVNYRLSVHSPSLIFVSPNLYWVGYFFPDTCTWWLPLLLASVCLVLYYETVSTCRLSFGMNYVLDNEGIFHRYLSSADHNVQVETRSITNLLQYFSSVNNCGNNAVSIFPQRVNTIGAQFSKKVSQPAHWTLVMAWLI